MGSDEGGGEYTYASPSFFFSDNLSDRVWTFGKDH
jgi:hypothetical protein